MRRSKEFKLHSPLIRKLLLANIVVVLLLFVNAKRMKKTDYHHEESHVNMLTMNEALASFRHYMHFLIRQYNLPHTSAQQQHDLTQTKLELIDDTIDLATDDLVELPAVIDLKTIYKAYLQSLYPKHFATTTEQTISRQIAKQRLQEFVLDSLFTDDQEQKRILWKQIKHSFISHQLDLVTFFDDTGSPVIPTQDFDRILQDTVEYINKHFKTKTNSKPKGFVAAVKSFFGKRS